MMILKQIKDFVDSIYHIDISDKTRKLEYVKARAIYYKLSEIFAPDYTLKSIADVVGRNHATVLHGRKTFNSFYISDTLFDKKYNSILSHAQEIFNKELSEEELLDKNYLDIIIHLKKQIENLKLKLHKSNMLNEIKINYEKPNRLKFNELSELSDAELLEFKETRLKPFLQMLKSRKRHKEINNVIGARLLR